MSDSFLIASDSAPSLPGLAAPSFFAELEAKGEFTGERLFQQRPDTYKAVVVLLGQRLGVIRIGGLLGVSPNTVMAVRDREGATIDLVKEHMANIANQGATLASEAILIALNQRAKDAHLLGIKDLKELAVVYGILVQNGQLLAGQPTARVELSAAQKPSEHDDFNRYISGLPTVQTTGLTVETSGQKEAAPLTPNGPNAIAGPGASGPVIEVATDSQSDG